MADINLLKFFIFYQLPWYAPAETYTHPQKSNGFFKKMIVNRRQTKSTGWQSECFIGRILSTVLPALMAVLEKQLLRVGALLDPWVQLRLWWEANHDYRASLGLVQAQSQSCKKSSGCQPIKMQNVCIVYNRFLTRNSSVWNISLIWQTYAHLSDYKSSSPNTTVLTSD